VNATARAVFLDDLHRSPGHQCEGEIARGNLGRPQRDPMGALLVGLAPHFRAVPAPHVPAQAPTSRPHDVQGNGLMRRPTRDNELRLSPDDLPDKTEYFVKGAPYPREVRIFPNAESCLRLVRALTVERHETWLEDHRYLNMDLLRAQEECVTPGGLTMLRPTKGMRSPLWCSLLLSVQSAGLLAIGHQCSHQHNRKPSYRSPLRTYNMHI
jgi:hypothetical protein